MNSINIKMLADSFECPEGSNFDDCCDYVNDKKYVLFIISRHKSNNTMTINIDNSRSYVIDADAAIKLLELLLNK